MIQKAAMLGALRCWKCTHLLFRYSLSKGTVEIKCPSCGAMTTIEQ